MPMIHFQCVACEKKFTELVNSRTKHSVKCPDCASPVKQIYEGKCNSLSGAARESAAPACCPGCSKSCPMQ